MKVKSVLLVSLAAILVLAACAPAAPEVVATEEIKPTATPAPEPTEEPRGCACGAVLTGVKTPTECPLYRRACTPDAPVGPCMVSGEGTCAAYYRYHREP